jgi:hypothetical protein
MNGHFTLTDTSTGVTTQSPYRSKIWDGSLTQIFEVSPGTYKVSFSGRKYGRY